MKISSLLVIVLLLGPWAAVLWTVIGTLLERRARQLKNDKNRSANNRNI